MPAVITGLLTLAAAIAVDHTRAIQGGSGDHGLTDEQLWMLVESGQSPLAGMTFEQAARFDPRRIDAMVQQEMIVAMRGLVGWSPGEAELRKRLYLAASALIREHNDGAKPLGAMVSLQEETWRDALLGAAQMWPPPMHEIVRANYDDEVGLGPAFGRAVAIAERAATVTRNTPDNVEWTTMATVFREMDQGMRDLLFRGRLPTTAQAPMLGQDVPGGQYRIQPHAEPVLISPELDEVGREALLTVGLDQADGTSWFYESDGPGYGLVLQLIESGHVELVDQGDDPEAFVEVRLTDKGVRALES